MASWPLNEPQTVKGLTGDRCCCKASSLTHVLNMLDAHGKHLLGSSPSRHAFSKLRGGTGKHTLRTQNIHEELTAYEMSPYSKTSPQPNSYRSPNPPFTSGLEDGEHLFVFSFSCQMYGNVKSQVMKKIQVREAAGSEAEGWLVVWQNLGHRGPGEQLKTRRSRIFLQI